MNNIKKIFISGPVSGNPDFMEDFRRVEKAIKKLGYEAINPTGLIRVYPSCSPDHWQFFAKKSLSLLLEADAICTFTDPAVTNEASERHELEMHIAEKLEYAILFENEIGQIMRIK